MAPKNKTSAKKYFTINCIYLMHKACQIVYQSVSLSPSTQLVPSSSSHSLLAFPSSSLPFHYIPSSVPIHCLKRFTIIYGEKHCHATVIHNE